MNYVYVRNFGTHGLLTLQKNKQHLSRPHTAWERYRTVADAETRLEQWGFVETTPHPGVGKKYFPEGTFSFRDIKPR